MAISGLYRHSLSHSPGIIFSIYFLITVLDCDDDQELRFTGNLVGCVAEIFGATLVIEEIDTVPKSVSREG